MSALLAAMAGPDFPARPVLVLSNRADAAGLGLTGGVPTAVVSSRGLEREAFEAELDARLREAGVELIALAGFMRVLTAGFVRAWQGRMINIHPSLLPSFPGLDTHARALAAGVRLHGCTVHWVSPDVDEGPIIAQSAVPVLPQDDAASLGARVLAREHALYPAALRLVAAGGGAAVTVPAATCHLDSLWLR
ncbi:MAG: phosphoribosylglycinamide formyltransferase [Rubritepida sp.]|nr:phosphoribosylglycinamide formyltransferase [Rubritepida sp.]